MARHGLVLFGLDSATAWHDDTPALCHIVVFTTSLALFGEWKMETHHKAFGIICGLDDTMGW